MLKQKSLRTFGKIAKIIFKERMPKFLYRTKVNNVSWKCIPYIYYSLAEKVGCSSGCKMWFVQFIEMATGEGAMSKKELVYTNVYNVKNYSIAPHEVNH